MSTVAARDIKVGDKIYVRGIKYSVTNVREDKIHLGYPGSMKMGLVFHCEWDKSLPGPESMACTEMDFAFDFIDPVSKVD